MRERRGAGRSARTDLEEVEDAAATLDVMAEERAEDRTDHILGVRRVVETEVHALGHVCVYTPLLVSTRVRTCISRLDMRTSRKELEEFVVFVVGKMGVRGS